MYGQCLPAVPCATGSINDYSCINLGNSSDLEANGKLLPFPGTASTQPQKIVVASYITFDDDYEFAPGTEIIMLPGALLDIYSDVRFIGQVTIKGCGGTWFGIRVRSNGTLSMKNSFMLNACEGIMLNSNSKAEITANIFIDNKKCIQAEGAVTLLGEGIAHNMFDQQTNSFPGCNPQSIPTAITLTNVPQITIGDVAQSGAPNEFFNYTYGIDAKNSNVDVINNSFEGASMAGIRLQGTGGVFTAEISGFGGGLASPLFVENCVRGVDATNYNVIIKNASFRTVEEAIYSVSNTLPVVLHVADCRIEDYASAGIRVSNSVIADAEISNVEIHDNNMGFEGERWGIFWNFNTLPNSLNRVRITDNRFYDDPKISPDPDFVKYKSYGAWILGSSKVRLEDNYFYQNYLSSIEHEFKGIWLFNAPSNELVGNDFVGNFGPFTITPTVLNRYRGIDVFNSGTNLISCNSSQNLNEGFFFNGPACDHTAFQYNEISDNSRDLYLSPGSIIGQQYERENSWPASTSGVAEAFFDGNPSQTLRFASQFLINSSNQNSPLWADPRIPATDWFDYSGNSPILPENQCVEEWDPNEDTRSVANTMAIGGTFEAYKGYPASTWEVELDAFGVLAEDANTRPAGSPEEVFYNTHLSANLGKLYRAKHAWENIALFTTAFEGDWNINQTAIATKLEEIRAQTQLMQEAETEAQQLQIAQTLATLHAALTALQLTNQSLSAQYKTDIAGKANQLASDLDNITTTDVWEQNLNTVLDLSVEKLLSETADWTTTQYNALKAIADQCRHEGGIGVVMARAAVGSYQYDDEAMCTGQGQPRSSNAARLKASIAPNPALEQCRITFDQPVSGQMVVHNFQGQVVRSIQLSEVAAFDLDVRTLPAGLYNLHVSTQQGTLLDEKIVVIH